MRTRFVCCCLLGTGLFALAAPLFAQAGLGYGVDSTGDGGNVVSSNDCDDGTGHCTLRAAIEAANAHPGVDTIGIVLPAGSVINLTRPLPDITEGVKINGPGASQVTVRRNSGGDYRIFNITASGVVTLVGMTISNGATNFFSDRDGGGIQNANAGTVNLNACVVSDNFASQGGGINNKALGTINLNNSTVSGNKADVCGGILNGSGGTVNVTNSVITANTALRFGGGGIYNNSGLVNVIGSVISSNHSQERGGGGVKNISGTVTLTNSRITGNVEESDIGGGILNSGGSLALTDCTVSGNAAFGAAGISNASGASVTITRCQVSGNMQGSAQLTGGGLANAGTATISNSTFAANSALTEGAGIYNSGVLTVRNSTIARNSATGTTHSAGDGAGIFNFTGATIQIGSSIVALNSGPGSSPDVIGAFASNGYNLIGRVGGATGFTAPTDQKGTVSAPLDPKLAAGLQDNGGTTQSLALLFGSPAIDKGTSNGLTTDQRGAAFSRTIDDASVPNAASGDGTDIGAFELQTPAPTVLANISTRLLVETGDSALIGGFIVTGSQSKKVIVRALGPSLSLAGALADPALELRNSSGALLDSNDNWRSNHEAEIVATGIPPSNDAESAIVTTLPANGASYTAIVRGVNNGTGFGVVEVYDVDRSVDSKLANISSRGLVQTGDNILIAGTIVLGQAPQRVLVRAIGPSLSNFGVVGPLPNPVLELRDQNGTLVRANDDWRSDQEQEIKDTSIPPTSDLESALVQTLPASGASYTAIVRGVNNATGIASVEIYALN